MEDDKRKSNILKSIFAVMMIIGIIVLMQKGFMITKIIIGFVIAMIGLVGFLWVHENPPKVKQDKEKKVNAKDLESVANEVKKELKRKNEKTENAVCPYCGTTFFRDEISCPNCGAKIDKK